MVMGKVVVQSDGRPWRPVIHIQDVARAFIKVLEAPINKIHNQAFNVGADHLNHQVIELAETAVKTVPGCKLEVVAQPGADQRTYKASFNKIAQAFPDFKFKWTIKEGAEELYETFEKLGLRPDTFTDKRFTRLKWLNHLLDTGKLDNSLRWNQS
jgi:nucleoside-diphosphate-sugar epimerase